MNCPGFGFSRHLLNEFLPNFCCPICKSISNRISKFLKRIPASASEYRARTGLDPTTHAEVCLNGSFVMY